MNTGSLDNMLQLFVLKNKIPVLDGRVVSLRTSVVTNYLNIIKQLHTHNNVKIT